jgi:hypothetical protein
MNMDDVLLFVVFFCTLALLTLTQRNILPDLHFILHCI